MNWRNTVKCKYIYKGHTFQNESQLDDFILEGGIELYSKYGDVVFSKAGDKKLNISSANHTVKNLKTVKNEAQDHIDKRNLFNELHLNYIDGEAVYELPNPYKGVVEYIRGMTNAKDILYTPEFREIEYWAKRLDAWKYNNFLNDEKELLGETVAITENVTESELKNFLEEYKKDENYTPTNTTLQYVKQIKDKWVALGRIGTHMHEVLKFLFTGDNNLNLSLKPEYLLEVLKKNSSKYPLSEDVLKDLIDYAKNLHADLDLKFGGVFSYMPEFLIVSLLPDPHPSKPDIHYVTGIIDLLVIDKLGRAHVIDYKFSPHNIFDSAKERSFLHLLGLYDRMLQQYNIPMANTDRILVAPIKMEGFLRNPDGKFTCAHISKRDSEYLRDYTNDCLTGTVASNLDEILPETLVVDMEPSEFTETLDKFRRTGFGEITFSKVWDDEKIAKLIKNAGGITEENGKFKFLASHKNFSGNSEKEVFDKVKKYYLEELPKERQRSADSTKRALKKGIETGSADLEWTPSRYVNQKEGGSIDYIRNRMAKYCNSQYTVIDNALFEAMGIICIKNIITKTVDFVQVVTDNLDIEHEFKDNNTDRTLITGNLSSDKNIARNNPDMLPATTGNIKLMELMMTINCIPSLMNSAKIGEILVINPLLNQGTHAPNLQLKNNFNVLMSLLLKEDPSFVNNMDSIRFATNMDRAADKLKEILSRAWDKGSKYANFSTVQSLHDNLDEALSSGNKQKAMKELQELRLFIEKDSRLKSETVLNGEKYDENTEVAKALYHKVLLAIAELNDIHFKQQYKDNANTIETLNVFNKGIKSLQADNPGHLDNDTLNLLYTLAVQAYQNTREDLVKTASTTRDLVDKLKESEGFNRFKQMTLGNASSLYSGMTEFKNNDLLFVNPWDENTSLSLEKREFLKHCILTINYDRFGKGIDLVEGCKRGETKYMRVPLKKASTSSHVEQMGGLWKALKHKVSKINPNPVNWAKDTWNSVAKVFTDPKLDKKFDKDLFEMTNMFAQGEKADDNTRQELINEHIVNGEYDGFFETNLETLLLTHNFAYSMQKNVNSIMPMAKAAMVHLTVEGGAHNKKYSNAMLYILDYIKNKLKGESIIDPKYEELLKKISGVRSAASFLVLAFRPVQYGYQTLLHLWTDIRLILQNLNNPNAAFTFENFAFAFKHLYKDFFKWGNKPSLCSLVNEYYGVNDMDTNVLADKLKSDNYGIYNITNLAFHCTSRPDYFSRMTLVIARMKKDGTWEAHSLVGNKLVYNFKKDRRFNLLTDPSSDKNSTEYKLLKALWLAMAKLMVNEGAKNEDGTNFVPDVNKPTLPKAYTSLEMESIKSVSDDIYGYYSHEKKSMMHATLLGSLYMQMRTYWSGKKNQYLGAPGVMILGSYKHAKDKNGNLLYLKLENGILVPTTDSTNAIPLMKWEGDWQEGIFVTLSTLIHNGIAKGYRKAWNDMWSEETDPLLRLLYRANITLLVYDLVLMMFVGPMLAGLMSDWEDELLDEAKKTKSFEDTLYATVGNMATTMVSSSFLDFNFFSSIGSPLVNWSPFALTYGVRLLENLWGVVVGDKEADKALLKIATASNEFLKVTEQVHD